MVQKSTGQLTDSYCWNPPMYKELVTFIKQKFADDIIPLHQPVFKGNENKYVLDTIASTFVSSIGRYVDLFEESIKVYTGARYAIATSNGTAALHMSLILAGVQRNDLVLTQALSFIATCNAVSYLGADPVFIDVDRATLGLSANALEEFLIEHTLQKDGACYHKESGRKISACVPMHTFGHPVEIDRIAVLCSEYHIPLVEDAAESIGSFYKSIHTGNFGLVAAFSFNGNKTVTCGGGGAIITNDEKLGKLGKHLTTQAKVPHRWEFVHDSIGYNYRLPNLNAALACAQMEQVEKFIANKRELAKAYEDFFADTPYQFFKEPVDSRSNYWLNAIFVENYGVRNEILAYLNDAGIMARPCWMPMHKLKMFRDCYRDTQTNTEWVVDHLVNLPSSYRPGIME